MKKILYFLLYIACFVVCYIVLGFLCNMLNIVYGALNSIALFGALIITITVYKIIKKAGRK